MAQDRNADIIEADAHAFRGWIATELRPKAKAIKPELSCFDQAMESVRFLPEVLALYENQPESVLPIWEFLDRILTEQSIRQGRAELRKHRDLFIRIEERFGVEAPVLAAIWGIETRYGTVRGDFPVLSALATLAWKSQRRPFFETQLFAALRIVEAGHVGWDEMIGSWAGAMGHGQFIPTSFLDFGVDFDGDGRSDIWGEDPADALASIANYLIRHQWRSGQPWGCEVKLPEGFDYRRIGQEQRLKTSEWNAHGVSCVSGEPMADYGDCSLLLPAGATGPAFLVFRNFDVLLKYNRSEPYAIGVGLLANRLLGQKSFAGSWPRDAEMLGRDEVRQLQERLTALGFDARGADGLIGPDTRRALMEFQASEDIVPDGFPTKALYEKVLARALVTGS